MNHKRYYIRARQSGYPASQALRVAKTLERWDDLEAAGLVRLRAEPEYENYFDVYGEPEGYTDIHGRYHSPEQERQEIVDQIERDGCWCIFADYRASEDDEWEWADSIGMNVGYPDPLSPFENWYVPDLMQSAIGSI